MANYSGGTNIAHVAFRQAANSLAAAGVVLVGVADNNYPGIMGDPGRAANIITVGSVNDFNQLTDYTGLGTFMEPIKPDVLAPGGSANITAGLMCVDSNHTDGWYDNTFPDRALDDYGNYGYGTSLAAPHVSGLAALVIQALEQTGYTWSYTQADAQLVKSLILMTATETNVPREINNWPVNDPVLNRGEKDRFEGYGMVNADAAVEAVLNSWPSSDPTHPLSITFGSEPTDRRCWAGAINQQADTVNIDLAMPATLDADVYIYRANFEDGDPELVARSVNPTQGGAEQLVFVPDPGIQYYLTIKRISGHGEATLNMWYSDAPNDLLPRTRLVGAYPNPFNPRTTVYFEMAREERVAVVIYDVAGRQVNILADQVFPAGSNKVVWDGSDGRGTAVASGTYFVRMKSDAGQESKKVLLVR